MSDETNLQANETLAAPPQAGGASQTPAPQQPPAEGEAFDQERAMKTIHSLREQEKEWKKQQKELEQLRAEQKQRAEAELTEVERLKKQADELAAQNAKLLDAQMRREVADEVGLPAIWADRLKGATKDEMLADAKAILPTLAPAQKKAPSLSPTNPPSPQTAETDAQKRARLFGTQSNVFNIDAIRAAGGGVRWAEPKEE